MWVLATITALAIFLVVYHHLFYPMMLSYVSRKASNNESAPVADTTDDSTLPKLELLIPAYNEQEFIAAKLMNVATLDYPAELLTVRIACDGCSDNTAELARQTIAQIDFCGFEFIVEEHTENRGKVAILNQYIAACQADVLVLSDVSALISIDALKVAAAHFADPKVGVVCAHYHLLSPGSKGEAVYWDYQRKIKVGEASLGAPLGAHGALYCLRSELFEALPADTINDDFVIPMNIVAKGYRSVYEPAMCALELEHASSELDHRRRQRIGAGNLQQFSRLRSLCMPKFGGVAFAFISGKALRVTMPLWMGVALIGSLVLCPECGYEVFRVLAAGQLLGYSLAMLPRLFPKRRWPGALLSLNYLVEGHMASFLGSLFYIKNKLMSAGRGRRLQIW